MAAAEDLMFRQLACFIPKRNQYSQPSAYRSNDYKAPKRPVVQDWQAAGLIKPSVVKPVIATVEQRLVRKSLGTLSSSDQQRLREAIKQIIG